MDEYGAKQSDTGVGKLKELRRKQLKCCFTMNLTLSRRIESEALRKEDCVQPFVLSHSHCSCIMHETCNISLCQTTHKHA